MSIFRELFVEVPLAILEAKARQAMPQVTPPTFSDFKISENQQAFEYLIKHRAADLQNKRGFVWMFTERRVDEMVTILRVKLACGHTGWFSFHECVEFITRYSIGGVVDRVIETLEGEPSRRCTCVPYVAPPPCTARRCK